MSPARPVKPRGRRAYKQHEVGEPYAWQDAAGSWHSAVRIYQRGRHVATAYDDGRVEVVPASPPAETP